MQIQHLLFILFFDMYKNFPTCPQSGHQRISPDCARYALSIIPESPSHGEGLEGNMLENRQKTTIIWKTVCVLAALMLGAFLGSPASKDLTGQISESISKVTIQAVKMQYLHNEDTDAQLQAGEEKGKQTAAFQKTTMQGLRELTAETEQTAVQTQKQSEEGAAQSGEGAIQTGDTTTEAFAAQTASFSSPANQSSQDLIPNANRGGAASRKEVDVLIHLINAEAYGLSYKAKVAVGQVVMNRWTGPYYGDDLLAIMTAPHQFTPIYNGSAYKKKIEPDSVQAAYAVLSGTGVPELTDDTYYFVNPDFTQDKTIETKMQFVCEIEGMHFFKPPAK
jgi:spore germination cell wall hydrolase CwlJ-like protein